MPYLGVTHRTQRASLPVRIRHLYPNGMVDVLDLRIRLATAADRTEHLRMRVALWGNENSSDQLSAEIDELHEAGRGVFPAETRDDNVIGFAEVSIRTFIESCDTRNAGCLEGWWVDPAHQGSSSPDMRAIYSPDLPQLSRSTSVSFSTSSSWRARLASSSRRPSTRYRAVSGPSSISPRYSRMWKTR